METAIPIVSTKLRPPAIREDIVPRPRLVKVLEQAVRRKLTLLRAGAGYGKTTLLSTVIASQYRVVWYSLSPSDWDLPVFVSYLVEGIRRLQPGFGDRILRLLSGEHGISVGPEVIAGQFVNGLSELEGREVVVVLDDYHLVDRSRAVRNLIDYLLIHLPDNSHLVISSRRSTRLSCLPRLRLIGQAHEVSESDLRFTPSEVEALFTQVYDLYLSSEVVGAITEQTEGWIIGLRLAAQSLKGKHVSETGNLLRSLGVNKKRLFEYLAEEVFRRQPANVRRFLCESSVLSVISSRDCDAIFRRNDSEAMLAHIERNNLFAVEVDEGCWRYHHLFRDFLRQQISAEHGRLHDLHRRAAIYFEDTRNHIQATQHYLAAADYRNAGRLICKVGESMLSASRFDTLTFWISQLPQDVLQEMPDLVFLQARVFELQGHYDRSEAWLERAALAFAAREDNTGVSKVLRSKAYMAAWRLGRHTEASALYREALDHLNPENRLEKADLLSCVALSYLPAGNPRAAREAYEEALRIYEELGHTEGILATLINPGTWIYWLRGDFSNGIASLNRALVLAEELDSKHRLAECWGGLAVTLPYVNRSYEAREYAQKAIELSREIGAIQLEAHNLTFLALGYVSGPSPDFRAARQYAQESTLLAEKEGNERIRISAMTVEVMALRRLGDLLEAARVGERLLDIAERSTDQWLIANVQLNVGAALIAQDNARAEALLHRAGETFALYEDKWSLTCTNFWTAALYSRLKPQEALDYFQVALELSMAKSYDFWFLEEHCFAVPLLAQAICHNIHADYCSHLLNEIGRNAVDDLKALLDDENIEVRRVAAEHIRTLAGEDEWTERDSRLAAVRQQSPTRDRKSVMSEALPASRPMPLRIYCLGNFRVFVGDRLVQESEWERKKVKSLLKYMATSRDHAVTRDELAEVFWGDLQPQAAKAALSRGLHVLRRTLEPNSAGSSSSYIASERGLLRLRLEMIEVIDVDVFLQHVDAAQRAERLGDLDRAAREYEDAEALYTGDFLADDPYEDWTIPRRERLRNLYLSTLEKLAKRHMDARDYQAAIPYLQKTLDHDCAQEHAHVLLMQCLARTGKRREALAQYAACCRALSQELDLDPTRETQVLYTKLLADEAI